MEVIGRFKEVDIIRIDKKQTINLIKEDNKLKLNKYASFKIYLTPNDVVELYNYIKREGLIWKKN